MSDLKTYLDHYRKKLDRNQHDKDVCIAVITKLNSIHVTKELLEETGIWKPLRTLSKKGDEVGRSALQLYKKWRKLIGDSPKKETIYQAPKLVASNSDSNISHLEHIIKPQFESPSKSTSKHQHLSSKSNSKPRIPSPSDFKHKIPLPNSNSKHNVTSPSPSKNSFTKKEVRPAVSIDAHVAKKQKDNLPCQDLNPDHNLVKSSSQDLKHNHKPVNQERKVTKPFTHESQKQDFSVKKHVGSSHDKSRSVPSHSNQESVSCEYNQSSYQKTTDKPPAHFKVDFNELTKTPDKKSSKLPSHSDSKNSSLLDSPFSSQKNKSSSCQKSESVFNSDASNAFLTISNSEKAGSTDQLNFEDDTNLASASSPAKKLVVEPYAIDMREGMFRVVKTSEDVPANIMRLQQIYDNDSMVEERSKKATLKIKDERNGKKPVNAQAQAKGVKVKTEGSPSTPTKNKKPSVGTKELSPKIKVPPSVPASQPLSGSPLVEKVPFLSVNKSKMSAEENSAFKESRKPLKKGETSSPHAQKVRKTSHIQ